MNVNNYWRGQLSANGAAVGR